MTRARFLLVSIAILGVLVGGVFYFLYSQNNLRLDFPEDKVGTISIYNDKKSVSFSNIHSNSVVNLPAGTYHYLFSNPKYTKDSLNFTKKDGENSLTLNEPAYSTSELSRLLSDQKSAISNAVEPILTNIPDKYIIRTTALFDRGDWAGVTITPTTYDPNNPEGLYRVVLQKTNNSWKVIGKPEFVLTKYTSRDIPIEVLTAVNLLN